MTPRPDSESDATPRDSGSDADSRPKSNPRPRDSGPGGRSGSHRTDWHSWLRRTDWLWMIIGGFYLLAYLFWYLPALRDLPDSAADPPSRFPWHWTLDFTATGLTGAVLLRLGIGRATELTAGGSGREDESGGAGESGGADGSRAADTSGGAGETDVSEGTDDRRATDGGEYGDRGGYGDGRPMGR